MVFSSTIFLFGFLPLSLLIYYIMPLKGRNPALFLLSLIFYGFGEPTYILVMLFSVTVAYLTGFPIGKYRESNPKKAKFWLILSVCLNLGMLVFFKYTNFILENLALIPPLAGVIEPIDGLTLPIGISFYTFQIMSYSIDLYRGSTDTQRSYVSFGAYVALFPQLIAGPIVRYRDVDDQLTTRTHSVDKFSSGVSRFTVGFAKKILLGDSLAALYAYFGTVYATEPTTLTAWLMVLTYTLHIYFDFSGYSDMAIGLGRMLGFEFLENFNYPYMASSITDFWRRWHISLSSWFREYVYIPLGGNRKGLSRQFINMGVVWFLTGLWHGAAWNFILWGVFYFVILALEKTFLLKWFEKNGTTRALGHVWALLLVGIGWMLFDHTDLPTAFAVIGGLFGLGTTGFTSATVTYELLRALPLLILSVVAATPYPAKLFRRWEQKKPSAAILRPILMALALLLAIAYMVSGTFSPFLYYIF